MSLAFLTAKWRSLAILNYRVPPSLLTPLVPRGTELDLWHGAAYVSLVGFLFRKTRVLGVPIPWHQSFEEVNLRFYVRRDVGGTVRHGVTFIRELVPHHAVSMVARLAYNEPYRTVPMRHAIGMVSAAGRPLSVEYAWRAHNSWSTLWIAPEGEGHRAEPGSEEEFITHHYWGYTRTRSGSTNEYEVRHAPWRVWRVGRVALEGDLADVYGDEFGEVLSTLPYSAMFANGSPVTVNRPTKVPRS